MVRSRGQGVPRAEDRARTTANIEAAGKIIEGRGGFIILFYLSYYFNLK